MHVNGLQRRPRATGAWLLVFIAAALPCSAQIVKQITDQRGGDYGVGPQGEARSGASLDDAGAFVFVNINTQHLGGNPGGVFQIFRFDAATGAGTQITSFPRGVSPRPQAVSVSDDGQWLAFISAADLLGQNHDASDEIFVMHPNGTGLAQVTNSPAVNAGSVTAVALSGSANRIVFLSTANPLGTNAANKLQAFDVDFNGANLRQLTTATVTPSNWSSIGISDDGLRIVFSNRANLTGGNADGSYEVFAIQSDGTGLRQLTSLVSIASSVPVISGNGTKVAYRVDNNTGGINSEIYGINWDGTGLIQITNSTLTAYSISPSITDDGQFVIFCSDQPSTGNPNNSDRNNEIWKIKTDGTGRTLVTNTTSPFEQTVPVVAGAGGRIAFVSTGSQFAGGNNPDGGPELHVMTGTGTNIRQLTVTQKVETAYPDITRDGTRIVFSSNSNSLGTNADRGEEVFRMQADGTGLVQMTNFSSADAENPTITADGNTIVFTADADPFGTNADDTYEIFRINANGTGLTQLTNTTFDTYEARISANGSKIVFYTSANLTGGNADGSWEIFSMNANGTGILQLTSGPNTSSTYYPHIDDNGTWVTFLSTANLTGANPNNTAQIYRIRSDGTGIQLVSPDVTGNSLYPDISGSGSRIAYISNANPLGTNADHSIELFVWDATAATTLQLTSAAPPAGAFPGTVLPASLTGNGNWIYFSASSPIAEFDPDYSHNLYRVPATSGAIERIGAFTPSQIFYPHQPRPDMTGNHVVFDCVDNTTNKNPDMSNEVFLIDLSTRPQIVVGKPAPTLVSWDPEAGPMRYDVVRGNVQNLAPGGGSTVTLGPVTCLEDDSPDADTAGFEDVAQPAAGQAFFYIYRGSRGLNFGAGSYGQSSSGLERIPASGDCSP